MNDNSSDYRGNGKYYTGNAEKLSNKEKQMDRECGLKTNHEAAVLKPSGGKQMKNQYTNQYMRESTVNTSKQQKKTVIQLLGFGGDFRRNHIIKDNEFDNRVNVAERVFARGKGAINTVVKAGDMRGGVADKNRTTLPKEHIYSFQYTPEIDVRTAKYHDDGIIRIHNGKMPELMGYTDTKTGDKITHLNRVKEKRDGESEVEASEINASGGKVRQVAEALYMADSKIWDIPKKFMTNIKAIEHIDNIIEKLIEVKYTQNNIILTTSGMKEEDCQKAITEAVKYKRNKILECKERLENFAYMCILYELGELKYDCDRQSFSDWYSNLRDTYSYEDEWSVDEEELAGDIVKAVRVQGFTSQYGSVNLERYTTALNKLIETSEKVLKESREQTNN